MLKNLSPVLTGDLLRTLDAMQPGDLLAIVSDNVPAHHAIVPAIDVSAASVESAIEAIFSVLPLASDQASPLTCWLGDPSDDEAVDIAFAVRGLASDAERRQVGMTTLSSDDFSVLMNDVASTVRFTTSTSPWAFLVRVGSN